MLLPRHARDKTSGWHQALILLLPPPSRLLRSLIGLKRVIINAAHFLVMKNKEFYRFYQTEPFLETVGGRRGSVLPPRVAGVLLQVDVMFCCSLVQDDRRATQESLPQRTLIELDPAGPRYRRRRLASPLNPLRFL